MLIHTKGLLPTVTRCQTTELFQNHPSSWQRRKATSWLPQAFPNALFLQFSPKWDPPHHQCPPHLLYDSPDGSRQGQQRTSAWLSFNNNPPAPPQTTEVFPLQRKTHCRDKRKPAVNFSTELHCRCMFGHKLAPTEVSRSLERQNTSHTKGRQRKQSELQGR